MKTLIKNKTTQQAKSWRQTTCANSMSFEFDKEYCIHITINVKNKKFAEKNIPLLDNFFLKLHKNKKKCNKAEQHVTCDVREFHKVQIFRTTLCIIHFRS